jgi:uncharacterized protein (TIGR03067 family)
MDTYFRFPCPNPVCGKRLKARPHQAGRHTRCPNCGQPVVPQPAAAPLPLPLPLARRTPPPRRDDLLVAPTGWAWAAGGVLGFLVLAGLGVWFLTRPPQTATAAPHAEQVAVVPATRPTAGDWSPPSAEEKPTPVPPPSPAARPNELVSPAPQATATPPAPDRPAKGDLAAKLVGDWKATDGSKWEVSFTTAEGVVIITPQVWHFAFYSWASADTIRFPAPPPARPGTDAVVRVTLDGDQLRLAFDGGPTITLVRTVFAAEPKSEVPAQGQPATRVPPRADGVNPFNPARGASGPWQLAEVRRIETDSQEVAFAPNGRSVIGVTSELEVSEWEVATGKRTRHSPAPGKHKLAGVSPDLRYGLSVRRPDEKTLGQLHLWDLTSGKSTRRWDEPAGEWEVYGPRGVVTANAVAFARYREPLFRRLPGDRIQIGGPRKEEVYQWDGRTGEAVGGKATRTDGLLAVSPDGGWLLTDDEQKRTHIWDAKTGALVRTLAAAVGRPTCASVSADNKLVVGSCHEKGEFPVVVWDATTGKVIHTLNGHKSFVRSAVISPDGSSLLCVERGDDEKGVRPAFRLWDLATGRELASHQVADMTDVYSAAFSPDGTQVVTAGSAGKGRRVVQVWANSTATSPPRKPDGTPASTPPKAKAEQGPLDGTWKLEKFEWAEEAGTSMLLLHNDHRVTIGGGRMTTRNEYDKTVTVTEYELTLDPSKSPAVYTQTTRDGQNKGKTTTGIYSLDGDTLRLCSKKKGLPTDFTITEGQDVKDKYVYTYKRVK